MLKTSKLTVPLAALLLLVVACVAVAAPNQPRERRMARRAQPPRFSTGGVYNGMIGWDITIDEATYHLQPGTQAYVLGEGLVPLISVPIGSRVFVSGGGAGDDAILRTVIVRPAIEERAAGSDMSSFVRVRSASTPD
jgi:hypothetical protein